MGWKERLECPVDTDGGYVNDRWTNRDLIPIPVERRTYKVWSFAIYWFVSGACISAYTTGSSLLAYGLTAQQAMACVVIGAMITGILSVVSGLPGEIHHVGFVIVSRMSWGMYGHYIPLTLSCFTSIFWFGIQAVWGGQAVNLMLGAMSPSWKNAPSKFPASANITHQDFTGVILWYCAFVPLVLLFPPEKLQKPFIFSSAAFGATLIGLLAWAVPNAGGGGPLFKTANTAESTSFSMMLGITSILSSWGAGTIGQSDWVRYSEKRYYPMLSQLVAAPVMITSCALVGVVVTSASSQILGLSQAELIWNPIFLLSAIQTHYGDSSGVRAAVFFAGLGCTCAQLSINVILNAVSTGMVLAGFAPRYINIKRGAILLGMLGLAVNPWQLTATASTFIGVISGFGIFIAPMTGIMLCDYLVIRRRRLVIPDLYIGDSSSIYWYWHGFHWRTIVAFLLGFCPLFPGFVMNLLGGHAQSGWVKLFQITFLVGLSIGFVSFLAICTISPPPHYREGENFLDDTKYAKSVARTNDPDYRPNASTHGHVTDQERVIGGSGSEPDDDDSEKAKSRDVTVNEMPVLR